MKQHIAFYGLGMAFAIAIAGLVVTRYRLSAVKTERTQLLTWQAQLLDQLGGAVGASPAYDRSRPLPAADAPEVLADIIGARDDALKLLAMTRPYELGAPVERDGAGDRGAVGQATPPQEIAQLLNRQSTGAAGSDVQAIDHDSQSPWKGWE